MLMQVIFILAMSLVVQNVVEDWLACEHPNIQTRTGFAMYGYIVRPLFLLLFCHIVAPDRKHTAGWILLGLNTAIYLLLVPGIVIALTVFAINLMGDGVRDALDPKLRD